MEIALTWNLVLLSAFVLLFAYSFLLGQNDTIKLILSMYIAILTADGIAGGLKRFVFDPSPGFQSILGEDTQFFTWIRMGLFLVTVVFFVVKSGFRILLDQHEKWAIRFLIHALFSGMSAILFISTMLVYMSGNSFVEGIAFAQEITIYQQSLLAQIFIDFYQLWFSLPAICFLITSFFFEPGKPEED